MREKRGGQRRPADGQNTPADPGAQGSGRALRGIRDHNDPVDTTGLPSLDNALGGILAGDNIVWHVDRIQD
ncbi:MAG TPA: hypothetical protein PLG22_18400, partial [Kiritimatiellia bacterium]|nr:hypothetical protein [Kiritimatiellia bacterium]